MPNDVEFIRKTPYGDLFRIRNEIIGPNSVALRVVTIWMKEYVSGETITVIVAEESKILPVHTDEILQVRRLENVSAM